VSICPSTDIGVCLIKLDKQKGLSVARIAEVVKTIPVQYGQCDVVVSGEMSVQEVLNQVVSG